MKGISPMIAVILLIAFTVAIGGVLSIWITGLTTTQTQQVSNQSAAQVKCSPSLTIERVDSNSPGIIYVTVSNPSQQAVASVSISVLDSRNSTNVTTTSLSNLNPGVSNYTAVGYFAVLPSQVRVTGLCSGLPVSFTCKPSDSCWRGT